VLNCFNSFFLQFVGHQAASIGTSYYGIHSTMDVYGHKLKVGQWSSTTFWIFHDGDGNKSSCNTIQVGWHVRFTFSLLPHAGSQLHINWISN
jgi:hypothetical protein